jgi:hypothetical protein
MGQSMVVRKLHDGPIKPEKSIQQIKLLSWSIGLRKLLQSGARQTLAVNLPPLHLIPALQVLRRNALIDRQRIRSKQTLFSNL